MAEGFTSEQAACPPETAWVERWAMRLDPKTEEALDRHARTCLMCAERRAAWQTLIAGLPEEAHQVFDAAAESVGTAARTARKRAPSERVYLRLRRARLRLAVSRRVHSYLASIRALAARPALSRSTVAWVFGVLLFCVGFSGWFFSEWQGELAEETADTVRTTAMPVKAVWADAKTGARNAAIWTNRRDEAGEASRAAMDGDGDRRVPGGGEPSGTALPEPITVVWIDRQTKAVHVIIVMRQVQSAQR